MVSDDVHAAARRLAAQAHEVGRASGRNRWHKALQRISRGRLAQPKGGPTASISGTPWQDTPSHERQGWLERAAKLDGEIVFAVDYQICDRCRCGWVEQPYTEPEYQRCGLASAGLAALRAEHPGLSWHTLGGHFRDSEAFWTAVGTGIPGGYQQRLPCPHIDSS
ncbi:MAG TPA: hypothetical protein VFV67_18915 [Actinophytocola sp.]|uniref:hypothetical protein n=1 Tax=Actinophytocola sp. TaxID=1872138 RepID=UPI002DB64965|nr:hypothetical protein [Actinophytocola sp.]HEU5472724.1 hypothetical protein [Actinophytocola sp.]